MKYLIVGCGIAGISAAEQIRRHDPRGSIIMFTEEKLPFYYRIRLIDYLAGAIGEEQLIGRQQEWYRQKDIELRTETRVVSGDVNRRVIRTHRQEEFFYDRLLLAAGSHSLVPPIPGAEIKGVFTLRNIEDARQILSCCREGRRVVMIGGGLLGLEAGNALRRRGMLVSVLEFLPRLLPRQLDGQGAAKLEGMMREMGLSFHIGRTVQRIEGKDSVEQVVLTNGDTLLTDMVIISAGVRPNLELPREMAIDCGRGVLVDSALMTSRPDVYAAGDVAEHDKIVYGLWPAAMQQGRAAGSNMAGGGVVYSGTVPEARLKVAGIDLVSLGNIDEENRCRCEIEESDRVYRKKVYDDDRLIGCILLGDTSDYAALSREIGSNVS